MCENYSCQKETNSKQSPDKWSAPSATAIKPPANLCAIIHSANHV